jgi:hypothetical protein
MLATGYAEIDSNQYCKRFPRTSRRVLSIVRDEWAAMGITAGTIPAARLEETLRPRVMKAVRQKYGFPWVTLALLIARIIIEIWIRKHSQEGCCIK